MQNISTTYSHIAINYPKETCALLSITRIVLHSEHRKRPGRGAFNFFAQIGQENILGNTLV